MATISAETGSGSSSANSYATEAQLTTYASDRGVTISGTNAVLLIQSMDYIEQQNYKGTKGTDDQALLWPRYGVWVDNYYVEEDSIPTLLKEAQMEIALGIDGGVNPLANESRETVMEKVDVISVEYSKTARNYTYLKAAEYKLKKLLSNSAGGISAVTIRG